MICIILHFVVLRSAGASPDLSGACANLCHGKSAPRSGPLPVWPVWPRLSFVMSAPASAHRWLLGVEPSGRSRSHGSCRSCEGQTDATGTKRAPEEHRQSRES